MKYIVTRTWIVNADSAGDALVNSNDDEPWGGSHVHQVPDDFELPLVVSHAHSEHDEWVIAVRDFTAAMRGATPPVVMTHVAKPGDYVCACGRKFILRNATDGVSDDRCGLCGDPARGFATIGDQRYCHGDDETLSCYMQISQAPPSADPLPLGPPGTGNTSGRVEMHVEPAPQDGAT